jgi:hypothetical protein
MMRMRSFAPTVCIEQAVPDRMELRWFANTPTTEEPSIAPAVLTEQAAPAPTALRSCADRIRSSEPARILLASRCTSTAQRTASTVENQPELFAPSDYPHGESVHLARAGLGDRHRAEAQALLTWATLGAVGRDREFADSPVERDGFELPRFMQGVIASFGAKPISSFNLSLPSVEVGRRAEGTFSESPPWTGAAPNTSPGAALYAGRD